MAYIDNANYILQIQPNGLPTFVRLSQNENGRNLYFQLSGNETAIPSSVTVTISGTKPDGNVYSATGSITNDVVLIQEDVQLTAVAGVWDAKIKITSGGNTIATGRVRFVIDADTVEPGSVPSDSELEGLVAEAQQYAETARIEAYGSPLKASAIAEMTDNTRVYVYTGTETGYTAGDWYYWNGSAWTDGGVYNAVAVDTDTTLSLAGKAADAKATGDTINDMKDDLGEWLSAAAVTPTVDRTAFGLTFTADDGDLLVYGTPTAARRFICLNGQDGTKTTSSVFDKTLDAGSYRIGMTVSGYSAPVVRWDYTYSTFSSANLQRLIELGEQPKIVTFTAPVMIAFTFGQVSGEDYGTAQTPTRVHISIEKLTAKDIVARPLQAVDTDTSDETGKTDMTPAIMEMLTNTGYCQLGEGVFYVSGNIDMPDGSMLCGCGYNTIVRLLSSVSEGYAVKMQGHSTISNIRLSGNYSAISVSSRGTRTGILFAANHDGTEGDTAYDSEFCMMENVWAENFTDSGMKCHNTSNNVRKGVHVTNAYFKNCWAGINIDYYSEFNKFVNVCTSLCRYGCINNGGNNVFTSCTFHSSYIGFYIDGTQPNSAHGTIDGCTFCHNGSSDGIAFKGESITAGFVVANSQFWYNSIELTGCQGILFDGCMFGRGVESDSPSSCATITISGGSLTLFNGCMFHNDVTRPPKITITSNTKTVFSGCYGTESGLPITAS